MEAQDGRTRCSIACDSWAIRWPTTPVAAVLERGGVDGVNAIMRTLVRVDQPVPEKLPDELRDYLADTLPLPEWADMGKIKRGQQLFETWGVLIVLCLFCASLPSSYAAAKGVKVLYLTARLDTDARRRVMETGQFLFDALTVGGLGERRQGPAHDSARAADARRRAPPDQGPQRPGPRPVAFPSGAPRSTRRTWPGPCLPSRVSLRIRFVRLGVRVSAEDVDAYLHVWNVIGHLLGVRDELLVHDLADATALVDAIRRRQFQASPQGQELTACADRSARRADTQPPVRRHDPSVDPPPDRRRDRRPVGRAGVASRRRHRAARARRQLVLRPYLRPERPRLRATN